MIDTTKLVSLEQTLDAFDNIVSVICLKDVDVIRIGDDIKIGADFEGMGVITKLSLFNPPIEKRSMLQYSPRLVL